MKTWLVTSVTLGIVFAIISIFIYTYNANSIALKIDNQIGAQNFSISKWKTNLYLFSNGYINRGKSDGTSGRIKKIDVTFTKDLQSTISLQDSNTNELISSAGINYSKDTLFLKINYNLNKIGELDKTKKWWDIDYYAYICLYFDDTTLGRKGCYQKANDYEKTFSKFVGQTIHLNKRGLFSYIVRPVYASTCSGTIPCGGITTKCTCSVSGTCQTDGASCLYPNVGTCNCNYNFCDTQRNNLDCSSLSDTNSTVCTGSSINNSCAVKCNNDAGPFCTWCQSNCSGKYCGSDGCGGSCGTCSTGYGCVAGSCCADAQSCPSSCGYAGGTVPNGLCGTNSCPATADCCSNTSPDVPTIVSPKNSQDFYEVTSVPLDWSAPASWGTECSGATRSYNICVGDNASDPCTGGTFETRNDPTTNFDWSHTGAGTHYWKVQAVNAAGATSAWSAIETFTTSVCAPTSPSTPTQSTPTDGATFSATSSIPLAWTAGAWGNECTTNNSRSYQVCVGNAPGSWGVDCTGGTLATVTDPTLTYSYAQNLPDTYSWKVRQMNKDGTYSSWSSTWTFVITNNYPVLGVPSPLEIPATGTTSISMPVSDADGATDINRIYFGFNDCTVATGDAANSNFERNLANYFGSMIAPNLSNNRGWSYIASINTGAACTGNTGDGKTWDGTTPNINPFSVASMSNTSGSVTTTNIVYSTSGDTLTGTWSISTNGLTPGSGLSYYSMSSDKELLYSTGSTTPAWTKLNALCVEGFDAANTAYVSNWSAWSACDASHKRTRTRTCTQDCLSVDDCAAVGTTETEDCLGTITGTLYDASDCAAGVCNCGGATIGGTSFVVAPDNGFDLIGGNTVTPNASGLYSFNAYLSGAPLSLNNFNFDFSNLVAAGRVGSAVPKAICPTPGTPFLYSCDFTDPTQPCKTSTYNFGFYRQFGGWWQAQGGSIYATTNVNTFIPSSIASSEQKLILPDGNGRDGLLNYGGSANLGNTSGVVVSDSGLEFNGTYDGTSYKYNYFNNIWSLLTKTTMTVGQTTLPAYVDNNNGGYMLLKYSGALTLDSLNVNGGKKYILLADSTVNITGNITVDSGSFLAIIAKGSITVDPAVTAMQGWYLSDGQIIFSCTDIGNDGCDQTDSQVTVSGTLIGWQGFTLARDMGLGNNTAPAEKFVYRLDLSQNAPEIFKVSYQVYGSYAP